VVGGPLARVPRRIWGVLLLLLPACAGCAASPVAFDEARARAHIDMLARRIGSRAIGTPANRQAREYLGGVLQDAGFIVRYQETDAVDSARGLTAHVVNIIASRDGQLRDAVALVSHYDSVPDGPGAADDALGVSTCLESARVLAGQRLRHSLFVLITDGEEAGLMGARAATTDAELASRVRTFLNFDGTGAAGPTLLFETGPGWNPPLSAWASGAATPRGASFGIEIYRRLPNDTDFTVLKGLGASGLNFAPVGDSYAYHTDRDIAQRVDAGTLRQEIANTIGTVRALDAMEWTRPKPEPPTFFDLFGRGAVVYGATIDAAIVWAAVLAGIAAWLLVTRQVVRERRLAGAIATAAWTCLAVTASLGGGIAAAWLIRALRSELNPWYAAPTAFFVFVASAGLWCGWLVRRVSALAPETWRPVRGPAATWWVTLPAWIVAALVLHRAAPAAGYLVAWPLLLAGAGVIVLRRWRATMVAASAVVLVASIALWARNSWVLLGFVVSLFGWLPIVAPVWIYPVTIAAASLMLAPPALAILAALAAPTRPARIGFALAGLTLSRGIIAWASPAYTTMRPEMRTVWYVQDDLRDQAWWEIGGSESSLDLSGSGPPGAAWERAVDAIPATVRLGPIGTPFAFRTRGVPVVTDVPAEISSRVSGGPAGQTSLDVTIVPHTPLTVRINLPPGLRPSVSSAAGAEMGGSWRVTYVAPPSSGVTMHLVFDGHALADLAGSTVVLITAGVPASAPGAWPSWLPRERATWRARTFIVTDLHLPAAR